MLHILDLHNYPILEQLQLEEALLRADDRNWCIINQGTPPAIVMGISSQPEKLIHLEKLNKNPIQIIRRFSGGGTVIVDEHTLFVTFIFSTKDLPVHPYPKSIMEWTKNIYQPLFLGNSFEVNENDYVINNLKFGGNAQSITKNRWLHHSSLLWDYKESMMEYLKIPHKAPEYRKGRDHLEFLFKLKKIWKDPLELKKALTNQLNSQFKTVLMNIDTAKETLSRPHRKSTTAINLNININENSDTFKMSECQA